MFLDRYIVDLFRWLHDVIWHREGERSVVPYVRLGEPIRGQYGILQQIHRNLPDDIPDRDVSVWMFQPFRSAGNNEDDLWLICLHLSAIKGERRTSFFTHRIEICRSSHWVDPQTKTYKAEMIFVHEYDFQGRSRFRDKWAIAIMKNIALLLKERSVDSIDWHSEIINSAKQLMVGEYPLINDRIS